MSMVFSTVVAVAGKAEAIAQFEQYMTQRDVQADCDFEREVLQADASGLPVAAQYSAMTSRYRPLLWGFLGNTEVSVCELAVLSLLYAETGDGVVRFEVGAQELFVDPDIYGLSQEGQDQVRRAQTLFNRTALEKFGIALDLAWAVDQDAEAQAEYLATAEENNEDGNEEADFAGQRDMNEAAHIALSSMVSPDQLRHALELGDEPF